MVFLELNDWQLTAWDKLGTRIAQQPVGASTAPGQLSFGADALRYSRSHPQQFNNRYLYSISADPISGDLRPAKNHADLIYHHLRHLQLPDEPVALCVSGHVTNQQLGLLLGICQEAAIKVVGFIDTAVAQSLSLPASGDYHVLDIELHRMTLSHMSVSAQHRECAQTLALDGAGTANIVDGWMNVIADEFVQKTRFDPLHAGHTEQQLYDQVSHWLTETGIVDRRVSVTNGEASRDIEIDARLLQDKLRQRLAGFDFDHIQRLVLSPRAASIAGLQSLLAERIACIDTCSESDLPRNCAVLAQGFTPTDVRRIVSVDIAASSTDALSPAVALQAATHLLHEHVAYALQNPRFNGQLAGAPSIGEQVDIAGVIYTAIRLE
jgi:hypothetical protein